MLGWKKHKLESRLLGEISKTSDMWMTPPLWQKAKRNWRASWWKWKRWWKSWLKTQHSENKDHGNWSHHLLVNRWENNGNSDRLYFLCLQKSLQIGTAATLLLGRKATTNLDSILKSRDISLLTKVCIVKAMVFHVQVWHERRLRWTIKT